MIKKLQKKNQLLCTSRRYREVVDLAKIRKTNLKFIGEHGGADRHSKLHASVRRMTDLSSMVNKFAPDLTISFCSPEAARISYGLGIKHIAFSDSPHAEAVMRLSVPFVQKLLIPWVISKNEFTKFGIRKENIIQYKAIDASVIVRTKSKRTTNDPLFSKIKKTILVRPEESQASYLSSKNVKTIKIIDSIVKEFPDYNIVILARYKPQITQLKMRFKNKVKVLNKVVEGKKLLESVDVFVGSGGTMTAEAALMGIPTISFSAVPNYIENYLQRVGLIKRTNEPDKINFQIKEYLKTNRKVTRQKANRILDSMEDPFFKLAKCIKMV